MGADIKRPFRPTPHQ